MRRRRNTASEAEPSVVPPDPDQAWKALSLVNDWVKHAEAKLGVVLAATGASGGVLFNLVRDRGHTSHAFNIAAVVCCAAVLAAGVCAMIGLCPVVRLHRRTADEAVNPLFFHDIARAYKGDAPSYGAVLHTLTTNPDDLVRPSGNRSTPTQVSRNASIAGRIERSRRSCSTCLHSGSSPRSSR